MLRNGLGRRLVVVGAFAALAGTSGLALAQPAGPGMMGGGYGGGGRGMMGGGGAWGPMGGRGMGRGVANMPGYLDALKAQLVITHSEQPAWRQYAETVTGVATQMQGLHQSMATQMPGATWAQRRDLMDQMFGARQEAYNTVHAAASKLLPELTPSQRDTAAAILPGLRAGGMMAGPGPGRGPGPGMMRGGVAPAAPSAVAPR